MAKAGKSPSQPKAEQDLLFEQLFQTYQQPILNYLYRMMGDGARAEELTQDVFVRAYGALPNLPADANHRAWLYRIATNLAYDQYRRSRIVRWLPLLQRDGDAVPTGSSGADPTAEQVAVERVLEQLPMDYRAPLILFSVHGYSTREIGEMLGISEGAVKTRLYRARVKFRELFWEKD
jgi:RNA polymerase sigma-70 factor (ECF subfamily)